MLTSLCLAPIFLNSLTVSLLPEKISLDGTWRLTQAEKKIDIAANVPGNVHVDLLRVKKIPDPYLGSNDKLVQWVGEVPWTYTKEFSVSTGFLKHRRIVLKCEGLDTLARIVVNGKEVARPNNMFRIWEFDVRPFVRVGKNQIQISFEPIEPFLKAHEVQEKFPGKPVQSHGWGYVRKPPYQQGWDFSPKLITAGIWRNISLVGWDEARLEDIEIVQDHRVKGKAGVAVHLSADTLDATNAITTISFKGKRVARLKTALVGGKGAASFNIDKPNLWWPSGMGPQNMYSVHVELQNAQGQVFDHTNRRIGLRTVTWLGKTEKTPLTLAVNGRRFFAKGSNWVPADALVVRTTPAQERKLVQKAVDANMNLMRLWGGGFYETDSFFDACDEKGLLVWFEFKYADATYPAFDSDWLTNIKAEAEDNVRRVRHHPSIAVYSGNNEVIGFITEQTTPSSMSRADYQLLFHHTLKDIVAKLAPDAAYTPGSPEIGDEHDWDVWHGSAKFESYRKVHGFMSEYGFQAFPVPQSIKEFTKPEDRTSVVSPVMRNHQRNWRDGNQLIVSTLLQTYRKPKDFDSTLWLSQIQQAAGVLTGVEHWRRDWPHSTGSLVWQFNDCWPSISWSMMDVYGRPKALYYQLRHAYAQVALSGLADAQTGTAELWIANDLPVAKAGRLDWAMLKLDGSVVQKGSKNVNIAAGTSSLKAETLDLQELTSRVGLEKVFISASLDIPGQPKPSTVLSFVKPKYLELQNPSIQASVKKAKGGYLVTLSSKKPALWSWIECEGLNYELSDNFIHLMPGSTHEILVTTKASWAAVKKALRVRSLFDTYVPGTLPNPVTVAEKDGTIVATADLAEIVGESAILEIGTPSNIGNWTRMEDGLKWQVRNAKPGTYHVTAIVSIPMNEQGSTFEVDVEGQKVTGKVPGTKSWTDYTEISLGEITLEKNGNITIRLQPKNMVNGHVMNLRQVKFSPLQ